MRSIERVMEQVDAFFVGNEVKVDGAFDGASHSALMFGATSGGFGGKNVPRSIEVLSEERDVERMERRRIFGAKDANAHGVFGIGALIRLGIQWRGGRGKPPATL